MMEPKTLILGILMVMAAVYAIMSAGSVVMWWGQ